MQKLNKKSRSRRNAIVAICIASVLLLCTVSAVVYQLSIPTYAYTIIDENRIRYITSQSQDLEEIFKEAEAFMGRRDAYELEETEEGTVITIKRCQRIVVSVKDEPKVLYTLGTTVKDLLVSNGIDIEEPWVVSVDLKEQTYDGMTFSVDYVETTIDSVVRPLKYGTLFCNDPSLAEGETELLFDGVDGEQETITTCVYVNGVQQSISVADNIEKVPAVPRVVAVGTGERVGEGRQFPLVGEDVLITEDGQQLRFSRVETFQATGYTAWIDDMTGTTACGTPARVGAVAVDPRVIPYFTKMYIVSEDGVYDYGISSAEDCGGAIKGKIIDLFFDTEGECWQFGRRNIKVYFLTEEEESE